MILCLNKKIVLDEDFVIFEKPDKVLLIFGCSKNWQKKSAGNHLFTAAKDEKYFSISPIFQTKFCLFVNFTTRIVMLGVLLYVQMMLPDFSHICMYLCSYVPSKL